MVYKKQFAAAIKVAGNTLRENGKRVKLPFQSEYSIFLKNQNIVRAMINIEIDGNHITPNGLVLDGGKSANLERFIENHRKFKFIERTSAIAANLGENVADSTVIIKYSFEKRKNAVDTVFIKGRDVHHYYPQPYVYPSPYSPPPYRPNDIWYCADPNAGMKGGTILGNSASVSRNANYTANINSVDNMSIATDSCDTNDVGITVQGSESDQTFDTCSSFAVEQEEYTIEFQLVGGEGISTKSKRVCPSCGKRVKSKHQYCPDDGTYLG